MKAKIQFIDTTVRSVAEELNRLQRKAYQLEADLVGVDTLPPLTETTEEIITSNEHWIAAIADERVIGCLSFEPKMNTLNICRLYVDPQFMRQGTGSRLIERLLQHTDGFERITVSTAKKNTPAIEFYVHHHFKVGMESFTPEGVELIHLERRL